MAKRMFLQNYQDTGLRGSEKCFRVKLEFATSPPAFPTSFKYIILVNPETCKTVYDLEVLIIRQFGYSRGTVASLSLDGFCLLSTESIGVISHDDQLRVSIIKESPSIKDKKGKYQKRPEGNITSELCNKSLQKNNQKLNEDKNLPISHLSPISKSKKKRRKSDSKCKTRQALNSSHEVCSFELNSVESSKDSARRKKRKLVCGSKPENHKRCKIESISNVFEPEAVPPLETSQTADSSLPACFSSKSQESDTSSKEKKFSQSAVTVGLTKDQPHNIATGGNLARVPVTEAKEQDSSLRISKPTKKVMKGHITFNSSSSSSDEETDRQNVSKNESSLSSWLRSAEAKSDESKQSLSMKNFKNPGLCTNVSSVYVNPKLPDQPPANADLKVKMDEKPEKNYNEMLPSTWPPRVDDIIAYKILEMSHDYTPVVSEYKEVRIQHVLPACASPIGVNSIQVEVLSPNTPVKRSTGKFEMDFGEDSDEETCDTTAILDWQTLLEPKHVR